MARDDWRARFWSKVQRAGPDECWLWQGGCSDGGYGQFDRDGRKIGAHRVAYEAIHGAIPRGSVVRHKCDNPRCVNPRHLLVGTHQDNMDDRTARGRGAIFRGQRNGRSKISDTTALRIYLAAKAGDRTQKEVAELFGVKPSQVSDIANKRSHKHITEGL